jgi:hypothetical protein
VLQLVFLVRLIRYLSYIIIFDLNVEIYVAVITFEPVTLSFPNGVKTITYGLNLKCIIENMNGFLKRTMNAYFSIYASD